MELGVEKVLLTPSHPVFRMGQWHLASELGTVNDRKCDFVYNFVLSRGHMLAVNGVSCATLGHGFQDPSVAHDYFGSQAVLCDLQNCVGWKAGLIEQVEQQCICGEVCRENGQTQQEHWLVQNSLQGPMVVDLAFLLRVHAAAMDSTRIPSTLRSSRITIKNQPHIPALPEIVPQLVEYYCNETTKMIEKSSCPHIVGAFCLWWVNAVHPFEDGNGRAARGLAFATTAHLQHRTPKVPNGLHSYFHEPETRKQYLAGLQEANVTCGICECCGEQVPKAFGTTSAATLVGLWSQIADP